MKKNIGLNIEYALVNGFFFIMYCASGSYGYNYLKYSDFGTEWIGFALTLVSVITLVFQMYMAPHLDRSKKWNERRLIIVTMIAIMILNGLLLIVPAGSWIIMVICIVSFALAAANMPFINSLAFAYEAQGKKINYGLGRGIGSIAYAISAAVIGALVSVLGGSDDMIVKILPLYMIITAGITAVCLAVMKDPVKVEDPDQKANTKISYLGFFRKYRKMMVAVAAMALVFFGHMLINTYMIDIVQAIGGDTADQGNAIFIQAVVELPMMAAFGYLLKKFKINTLLVAACVFYTIKHFLIAAAPNMTVFYLAMVFQAFSFAVLTPASVYFAKEHVLPEDRNEGQAVVNAAVTVGGILASFFGGILLSTISVHGVLILGVSVTALGAVLMFIGTRIVSRA